MSDPVKPSAKAVVAKSNRSNKGNSDTGTTEINGEGAADSEPQVNGETPAEAITHALSGFRIQEGASYPPRLGNNITFFYTRPAFFAHLEQAALVPCQPGEEIFVAISFVEWDFTLPSGKAWWEVLNECTKRGANVCVLLWSPLVPRRWGGVIANVPKNQTKAKKCWQFRYAWDESPWNSHCHHQKYFYTARHGAYVGGMVMTGSSIQVEPNGAGHDTFVELSYGSPAAMDVRDNFVLRWNDVLGGENAIVDSGHVQRNNAPLPIIAPVTRGLATPSEEGSTPQQNAEGVVSFPRTREFAVPAQVTFSCPGRHTYSFRPDGERSVRNNRTPFSFFFINSRAGSTPTLDQWG